MTDVQNWVWTERYRPKTIDECILPERYKETFKGFVKAESIPNLILTGGPGIGKTTIARAMAREMNAEVLMINASMYGNIDTLRTDIQTFCSTLSLNYDRKVVILDESDHLNPNSTQPALRHFMEQFHDVLFILTCNYLNKIIEPLQSRTTIVDFRFSAADKSAMVSQFFSRVKDILRENDVEYDVNVLVELIVKHFPDMRRVINELQRYAVGHGKLDSGVLITTNITTMEKMVDALKQKNFAAVRRWCGENPDTIQDAGFYTALYEVLKDAVMPESLPSVIMAIAEYQYKHAFVIDKEINTAACLAVIMVEAVFK